MSSKTPTPSRQVKSAKARRFPAAARRKATSRTAAAPSPKNSVNVKQPATTASVVPLAKRALKTVKSKAGLAVLTGVALAVGAGLVRKYRTAS